MATEVIKGINFLLYVGDQPVAGQRNANLSVSADNIDVTNKLGDGWAENIASFRSWSIDADGLIVPSDEAYEALESAAMNGTQVTVKLSTGTNGRTYTGTAYITDWSIGMPYDDATTYTCTITGTGPLTRTGTGA